MNPLVRNILGLIAGIAVGMIVNMGIIILSPSLIPPPEGVDPTSMESIQENFHLYRPIHFLMPFLAHAIGTLAGAYAAIRISADKKIIYALIVGSFFLLGGIANIFMIGGPVWFNVIDLVLAYLPMGWLGHRLATMNGNN